MELDPERADKQRLLDAATSRVLDWLDALPAADIAHEGDPARARALRWDPPSDGRPIDDVLEDLFSQVVPLGYNVAHPGFMAYVPNTALWSAAVADVIADALDRYPTVRVAGAGPARMEDEVIRWFCEWIGYPELAGGNLTSGGSMANLSAFVAARTAWGEDDLRRLRWYGSEQTHHSNHKAAQMAGIPGHGFVTVVSDGRGRIDPSALEAAMDADREAGFVPFLVVGNAGTTDTGAVDDLHALADLCQKERVWLHADAAYGGFFVLAPRGKKLLAGLPRADSVTLDPHKGLGLPFGVGCLLAKDPKTLLAAHAMRGDYMPAAGEESDASDLGPELSRSWRGLRVWLPIMVHGLERFRVAVDQALDLAADAARRIEAIEGITLHRHPELSAFAFRLDDGVATRALLKAINERHRVFLSGTRFGGHHWIRVCILNAKTGPEHVQMLVEDLRLALQS